MSSSGPLNVYLTPVVELVVALAVWLYSIRELADSCSCFWQGIKTPDEGRKCQILRLSKRPITFTSLKSKAILAKVKQQPKTDHGQRPPPAIASPHLGNASNLTKLKKNRDATA